MIRFSDGSSWAAFVAVKLVCRRSLFMSNMISAKQLVQPKAHFGGKLLV